MVMLFPINPDSFFNLILFLTFIPWCSSILSHMICQIHKFYREAGSLSYMRSDCNRLFCTFPSVRERERESPHTHTHTQRKRVLTQIFKSCLVFDWHH
jgi:hypothetical protein